MIFKDKVFIYLFMRSVYSLTESQNWDTVARSFNHYDVYWLGGYVRAFHIHGDGDPLLLYYEDKETRGINVVMKRDVALDSHFIGKLNPKTYFNFSSRYGEEEINRQFELIRGFELLNG